MNNAASRSAVKLWLLSMLLCITVSMSHAQETPATLAREYGIDHWGEKEGLTHPRIKSVMQTRDGYLWLGTSAGLARFDGITFTSFNMQTGSLRENIVTGLAEDRNGVLYAATAGGGLAVYERGRFMSLTSTNGLPDDSITCIDCDPDGRVWLGTPRGLCRIGNRAITIFNTNSGLPSGAIQALSASSSMGVIVAIGGDVYHFVNGHFEAQPGIADSGNNRLLAMFGTRDGALWTLFETATIKRVKDGVATVYRKEQQVPAHPMTVYQDPQGVIWVGATDGLWRLRDGRFERLVFPGDKTRRGAVWSLTSDAEGSLWAGYESDGLARLRLSRVSTITALDGLPDDSTRCAFCDSKQRLWIGTVAGLAMIEQGETHRYVELDGVPISAVNAIGETPDGSIWIGAGGQLMTVTNNRLALCPGWKRVQDIRVIYRDSLNRMWVGTDDAGLFKIENGVTTQYGSADGLVSAQIRSILLDQKKRLWVGTYKGLNRWENGKFIECRTSEQVAPSRVVDIHESADGTIWFATRNGLSRFANDKFFNFTAQDGLFGTYPYCIQEPDSEFLWLSCFQGIFKVSKAELNRLADGQIKRVSSVSLGIPDGMASTAFTGGTQPPGCMTADGRMLFCSLKGVVVVDPKNMVKNSRVPPIIIENVIVNDKAQPTGVKAMIDPGDGNVQIDYAGLSFLNPEKVRFRYRMEGVDKEWVEAGSRRMVYYANLAPGNYRFQVIACNADGVWNTKGDSFSFVLLPHFYQTKWFIVVVSLWAVLFVGIYIQVRISRHEKRERELQRRVDEALARVKVLSGLLPICASCKKVRDDSGYWNQLESYLTRHSSLELSHGICPDCMRKLYPEMADQILSSLSLAEGGEKKPKPPV